MRRTHVIACALIIAGGSLLSACAPKAAVITKPGGTETAILSPDKQENMGTENQLIVEGRNRGSIRMLAVKESRPNGYLRLQVGFQNLSDKDQYLEFEVHFFDVSGYPIKETSGWQPLSVVGHGVAYASVTCIHREASTYRVHMTYR